MALLLYDSGKQEIFCAIKSLILDGSCSNFKYFSLKIGIRFCQVFNLYLQK